MSRRNESEVATAWLDPRGLIRYLSKPVDSPKNSEISHLPR